MQLARVELLRLTGKFDDYVDMDEVYEKYYACGWELSGKIFGAYRWNM